MTKKPFPFSVCEQCCGSGDVSPEQIEEAVEKYLEENPITGTGEVYTVVVTQNTSGNYSLVQGNFNEIKNAYNDKKVIVMYDIELGHCAMLWMINTVSATFCCNTATMCHIYEVTVGGSVYSHIMPMATLQEVDNRINAAIGEALEGDY